MKQDEPVVVREEHTVPPDYDQDQTALWLCSLKSDYPCRINLPTGDRIFLTMESLDKYIDQMDVRITLIRRRLKK